MSLHLWRRIESWPGVSLVVCDIACPSWPYLPSVGPYGSVLCEDGPVAQVVRAHA